jgi:hypothetical protein
MQVILSPVFALLVAFELVIVIVVVIVIANGAVVGWTESPGTTVALALVLLLSVVGLWRSHMAATANTAEPTAVHPGINFSRVPTTGAGGAIFMLQFVVWLVVAPAVGVLYGILIAGGLALLPVAWYVNRRRSGVAKVGIGSVLGVLAAALYASIVPFRQTPLAWIVPVAVPAGVLGAGLLIWKRSGEKHPSIAPYRE